MPVEELILRAREGRIRWGSAFPVRGQRKLDVEFDNPQNRILVFEDAPGTAEYVFVLKDAVPWGVDLRRFFELEGSDQGLAGAVEVHVRSIRPGRARLEGERELVVTSQGIVAPSSL